MSSKKVKQLSVKTNTVEEPVQSEPVQSEPVQSELTQTEPVQSEPTHNNGKKVGKKAKAVVDETVPTPVPVQKAGKKATKAVVDDTVPTPVPVQKAGKKDTKDVVDETVPTPFPVQKAGKKAKAVVDETVPTSAPVQKAGKKAKAKAVVDETVPTSAPVQKAGKKSTSIKKVDSTINVESDETITRRGRSFKVKLPNKEEFEGRFTGLTPYQAANKALSKYFRETVNPTHEVTFSICESTRKSKKSVYTYIGGRQKLDVPIIYTIQDGREIIKNFKNSLKKVKKSEMNIIPNTSVTESA
jgi:hypothetical protein